MAAINYLARVNSHPFMPLHFHSSNREDWFELHQNELHQNDRLIFLRCIFIVFLNLVDY